MLTNVTDRLSKKVRPFASPSIMPYHQLHRIMRVQVQDAVYSLNFWIPLTRVSEASALWLEGATGVGELGGELGGEIGGAAEGPRTPYARAPHYLALMDASRFDGRSTIHFTVPNRSTRTRVSIDFRVVPGVRFEPSCRLARLGYFSACERHGERFSVGAGGPRDGRRDDDDGARSGKFRKVASGRVSKLHGMPHEAKPVVLDAAMTQVFMPRVLR